MIVFSGFVVCIWGHVRLPPPHRGINLRQGNAWWCVAFHRIACARVRLVVVCDARVSFNFIDMCCVVLDISGAEELVRIAEKLCVGLVSKV